MSNLHGVPRHPPAPKRKAWVRGIEFPGPGALAMAKRAAGEGLALTIYAKRLPLRPVPRSVHRVDLGALDVD